MPVLLRRCIALLPGSKSARLPAFTAVPTSWLAAGAATLICLVLLPVIFGATARAMLAAWDGTTAYSYCFLVLPLCAWLTWQRRDRLLAVHPQPAVAGFLLLLAAAAAWLLGDLSGSMVVAEFALVAMAQGIIIALLGLTAARVLVFPLAYLLFLVPAGESLIPPLQAFTADFTVALLRLAGLPVRADGLVIQMPGMTWAVAEACAGLKFLIASVAIGALLSEMFLQSWRRRALFMLLSVAVPVIANGLRAFLVVLIAYHTDNKYATGVDHLLYGWVLFALVLAGMIAIAIAMREPTAAAMSFPRDTKPAAAPASFGLAALLVLALLLAVRAGAAALDRPPAAIVIPARPILSAGHGWMPVAQADPSPPVFAGADRVWHRAYGDGVHVVHLHVGYFAYERHGAEAASSSHNLPGVRASLLTAEGRQIIVIGGQRFAARMMDLGARRQPLRRRLLSWYWVDGRFTGNPYAAKLLQLKARLSGAPRAAAVITLSLTHARGPGRDEAANAALARFADGMAIAPGF